MKGCMSTDLGIITIDPEVIAKYAGTEVNGMAAKYAGTVKKESLRGIRVYSEESLSFHHCCVWRKYLRLRIMMNVKYRGKVFGMPVDKINIYIEGYASLINHEDIRSGYKEICLRRCFLQARRI